jgi:hypothetical protein
MPINSRSKGKRGELQARDVCRQDWYADNCERAGQTSGGVCADIIRALPQSCIEVKYLKKIGAFRFYEQCEEDAPEGDLPIVMMKETGRDLWLVAFDARQAESYVARFLRAMHLANSPEVVDKFVSDALHAA